MRCLYGRNSSRRFRWADLVNCYPLFLVIVVVVVVLVKRGNTTDGHKTYRRGPRC